jgi:HlyD family secretion protein
MPIPKKRKKIFILVAIVVVVVALMLVALMKKREPVVTVQTEKVGRHTITEQVVANGKIYPVMQVHISPEVSGEIIVLAVKEGQRVKKGDLLLKILPDVYLAQVNQAKANYESSRAAKDQADANLEKAEADYTRNNELFEHKLISASDFVTFKVARDVARAQVESARDQVEMAKASVDSAQDSLIKTTIVAPIDGTVTTLNSQLGERVLGTVQNVGTDIMTISDLSEMEARVDIGEMDIVLLRIGEKAKLEVDSFKDKKFDGEVSAVANASKDMSSSSGLGGSSSSTSQTATQFQVRIHVLDHEAFRPGMSVTAEIETRTRTNTLAVPIASVTTRIIKAGGKSGGTNQLARTMDDPPTNTAAKTTTVNDTNAVAKAGSVTDTNAPGHKAEKPVEVVFLVNNDHVKCAPVKIGIGDDNYWEITDGLKEGDEVVIGNYRAISKDLDDGKKITRGTADMSKSKM